MSPRALLVAALIALCAAAPLPQPSFPRFPALSVEHPVRQLQQTQTVPTDDSGKRRTGKTGERKRGKARKNGDGRDGTDVGNEEGSGEEVNGEGKTGGTENEGKDDAKGEGKTDGVIGKQPASDSKGGESESGSGETQSAGTGVTPGDAGGIESDSTDEAGTKPTTGNEPIVNTPPDTNDGSDTGEGTETKGDESPGKGRDTPRETSGEPSYPQPRTPSQPVETVPESDNKPENPDLAVDGEPRIASELPVRLIGGGIAASLFCLLAIGLYMRRSNQPVYTPVQGEDLDADGWNDGWDDGWGEGAGNEEEAAKV